MMNIWKKKNVKNNLTLLVNVSSCLLVCECWTYWENVSTNGLR